MSNTMNFTGEQEHFQNPHEQNRLPLCWCNGAPRLEGVEWINQLMNMITRTVEEALERKLPSKTSSLPHQAEPSVSRSFRLCLKGKMPDTILTKDNIEDQGASLELQLCDDTGKRLEEVDPDMNNLKIMISALDGFKFDDSDNFAVEDFDSHVAVPRKGKPSVLLDGNYEISLTNGFARVHGISFTDNSRVRLDGEFKLGAKVIKGLPFGSIVRPAVTEAFKVKEHRGKDGLKYPNPSPNDDINRLVNINKKGEIYKRAKDVNIKTVLDFLQLHNTDAKKLQDILGLTGKKWTGTVNNAKACRLTNKLCKYRYRDDASEDVLLLKCDFGIESVEFKGQKDQPYDSLTEFQKEKVCNLRKAAYEKRGELEKVDASINQIPVQDGLECSYGVEWQKQQQAISTLSPCSTPSAYMHIGTTVTDHDNCQQGVMNVSAFSSMGAYGGNHTNVAIGNMNQQVANGEFALSVLDFTAANPDINQQGVMNTSTCPSASMYGIACWGETSQLNEPLNDIWMLQAQNEADKGWASANQTSVAAPGAGSENLNASSHEPNQMHSSNSPSNPLLVDPMPSDQGNMCDSSPGNFESLKGVKRLASIDLTDSYAHLLDFLRTPPPPPEERSNSSARDSVTSKLITTCYVTKAATLFMISFQQNPASASPTKKQKLR